MQTYFVGLLPLSFYIIQEGAKEAMNKQKKLPSDTRMASEKDESPIAESAGTHTTVSTEEYKAMVRESWTEEEFQRQVIQLAHDYG